MRQRPRLQRDLFERKRELPKVPAALRGALVQLIERLLIEALADDRGETSVAAPAAREAVHEQDHA
jgi:hypothetical protein